MTLKHKCSAYFSIYDIANLDGKNKQYISQFLCSWIVIIILLYKFIAIAGQDTFFELCNFYVCSLEVKFVTLTGKNRGKIKHGLKYWVLWLFHKCNFYLRFLCFKLSSFVLKVGQGVLPKIWKEAKRMGRLVLRSQILDVEVCTNSLLQQTFCDILIFDFWCISQLLLLVIFIVTEV